jgi:hypothetical protein
MNRQRDPASTGASNNSSSRAIIALACSCTNEFFSLSMREIIPAQLTQRTGRAQSPWIFRCISTVDFALSRQGQHDDLCILGGRNHGAGNCLEVLFVIMFLFFLLGLSCIAFAPIIC